MMERQSQKDVKEIQSSLTAETKYNSGKIPIAMSNVTKQNKMTRGGKKGK